MKNDKQKSQPKKAFKIVVKKVDKASAKEPVKLF